jgi:flagellar biosynthesis protein FlhF
MNALALPHPAAATAAASASAGPAIAGGPMSGSGPLQIIPFIAESAEDAVAQIRRKLGSDAVVVNVRQLPAEGFSKLWKAPRIEVLAYKPEAPDTAPAPDPLLELKRELQALRNQLEPAPPTASTSFPPTPIASTPAIASPRGARSGGAHSWRVGEVLESSGLMPVNVHRVIERLQSSHGELPPASLPEELLMTRATLTGLWRQVPEAGHRDRRPHVLIGPPGVGKTTCICKWLAQTRLVDGRSAQVWRLDGSTANTAEALSVYCEILGVQAERTWDGADGSRSAEFAFIDLPGVEWRSAAAIQDLKRTLDTFGPCHVHLVLNTAYEIPLLMAQIRAFSALPIEDLILTHLDEEPRWGKIWNIVLGTNYPVRYLSAAQNVPGEFHPATAERILARQFHG